jgi:hypothetical protein
MKDIANRKSRIDEGKAIISAFKHHPYQSLGWSQPKLGKKPSKLPIETDLSVSAANLKSQIGIHPPSAKIVDISKSTGFKPSRLVVFEGFDKDGRHVPDTDLYSMQLEEQLERQIKTDIDRLLDKPEQIVRVPSPILRHRNLKYKPLVIDKESAARFDHILGTFIQSQKKEFDYLLCCLPSKTPDYFLSLTHRGKRGRSSKQKSAKRKKTQGNRSRQLTGINEESSILSSIENSLDDPRHRHGASQSEIDQLKEILPSSAKKGAYNKQQRAASKFSSVFSASPSRKGTNFGSKDRYTMVLDQNEKQIKHEIAQIDTELVEMKDYVEETKHALNKSGLKKPNEASSLHDSGQLISKPTRHETAFSNSQNQNPASMLENPYREFNQRVLSQAAASKNIFEDPTATIQAQKVARHDNEKAFRVSNAGTKSMLLSYNQRFKMQRFNQLVGRLSKSKESVLAPYAPIIRPPLPPKPSGDQLLVHESRDGVVRVAQNFDLRAFMDD